jgi:hypothetical protein
MPGSRLDVRNDARHVRSRCEALAPHLLDDQVSVQCEAAAGHDGEHVARISLSWSIERAPRVVASDPSTPSRD